MKQRKEMTRTETERLAVVEEQIKEIKTSIKTGFDESKGFHSELITRIDSLLTTINDDRTKMASKIATLEERARTNAKVIWTALTAGVGGFAIGLVELLKKGS